MDEEDVKNHNMADAELHGQTESFLYFGALRFRCLELLTSSPELDDAGEMSWWSAENIRHKQVWKRNKSLSPACGFRCCGMRLRCCRNKMYYNKSGEQHPKGNSENDRNNSAPTQDHIYCGLVLGGLRSPIAARG